MVYGGLVDGDTVIARINSGKITLMKNRPTSNENMLTNWYFKSPVNQRNFTTMTNAGSFILDRWWCHNYHGTTSYAESVGLTLEFSDNVTDPEPIHYNAAMWQFLTAIKSENYNKEITFSVLVQDVAFTEGASGQWCGIGYGYGNGSSVFNGITKTESQLSTSEVYENKTGLTLLTFSGQFNAEQAGTRNYEGIVIGVHGGNKPASCKVIAAKVELGNRQTLAHKDINGNWILNDFVPNYADELSKCQMYYNNLSNFNNSLELYVGFVIANTKNKAYGFYYAPTSMIGRPAVLTNCSADNPFGLTGTFADGQSIQDSVVTSITTYTLSSNVWGFYITSSKELVPGNVYYLFGRTQSNCQFALTNNF